MANLPAKALKHKRLAPTLVLVAVVLLASWTGTRTAATSLASGLSSLSSCPRWP
jgi:hypothetical protein